MKVISVPFSFTSDTGRVTTTESINKIVEQQILDILTTGNGERVMVSRYGSDIRSLLFEEMDPLIFAEYKIDAIQDLNESLTIGKVTNMQISMAEEDFYGTEYETSINVSIQYSVPPFGSSVVTFNLTNSQTTLLGGSL
jgi:phage baseplate assembly protein W